MDADISKLEAQLEKTAGHWRGAGAFLVLVGLLIVGVSLAKGWWLGAAVAVLASGAFVMLIFKLVRRSSFEGNPCLLDLRDSPTRIIELQHVVASSSAGAFPHDFLVIRNEHRKHFGFRVRRDEIADFAELLRRRCPNASTSGPWFETTSENAAG